MVYPTRAPVLWFAREAVTVEGWDTLEVLGEPGDHPDPVGWERDCAERALAAAGSNRVLVVGKSLASLLAGLVSDRGLPAVWLTPALTEDSLVKDLARVSPPTLLLGGTADSMWRREVIPANPALEVLEVPGADHALQVQGDLAGSLDALRQMTDGIRSWLRRTS
jgi:predicted alpha/beta-hydrolase family hydrolase